MPGDEESKEFADRYAAQNGGKALTAKVSKEAEAPKATSPKAKAKAKEGGENQPTEKKVMKP